MTKKFAAAPVSINAARAAALLKASTPSGSYVTGDVTHQQYLSDFGMVTVSTDGWGDQTFCLLRYEG